jgi:putative chitinase
VCTQVEVSRTWQALEQQLGERHLLTWGCVIGSLAAIGVLAPSFRPTREIGDDALLERRYAGRQDLGNTRPGDASRYRARGFYPITGRLAYRRYGRRLQLGLEGKPELVTQPDVAAAVLLTILADRDLPRLANLGDWEGIRRAINPSFRNWPVFMVMVRRLEAIAAHRQTTGAARLKRGQVIRDATDVVPDEGGTSIFAPEGTLIYAPAAGRSEPALDRAGGFATRIEESNGRVHHLARGSTPFVGGVVRQGQPIGRVGSTGTGPGGFASAGGTPPHLLYSISEPDSGSGIVQRAPDPVAWGEAARRRGRRRGGS